MNDKSCFRFRWLIPFAVIGVIALFTYAVYALWNGVLVDVVAVKAISYWQALGILALAKLLFGGFPGRHGGGGPGGWRGRMMARRWQSMDPEQRERMREEMRRRFGDWPRPPWDDGETAPEQPAKPSGP